MSTRPTTMLIACRDRCRIAATCQSRRGDPDAHIDMDDPVRHRSDLGDRTSAGSNLRSEFSGLSAGLRQKRQLYRLWIHNDGFVPGERVRSCRPMHHESLLLGRQTLSTALLQVLGFGYAAALSTPADAPGGQISFTFCFTSGRSPRQKRPKPACANNRISRNASMLLTRSRPRPQNIPLSFFRNLLFASRHSAADKRGVSRSSRTWCGMRWTDRCRWTCGIDADGEVVWSWRPKVWRQVRDNADALR